MARINLPLLKDAIEMLGVALADHHHQWTPQQRRLWERAWVEIRRNWDGADPSDPPVPVHRQANKGVNRYLGQGHGGLSREYTTRKVI